MNKNPAYPAQVQTHLCSAKLASEIQSPIEELVAEIATETDFMDATIERLNQKLARASASYPEPPPEPTAERPCPPSTLERDLQQIASTLRSQRQQIETAVNNCRL